MLFRPTAIGEVYNSQLAAALVGLTLALLLCSVWRAKAEGLVDISPQAALFFIAVLYVAIRSVSAGGMFAVNGLKGLAVGMAGLFAVVAVNLTPESRLKFYSAAAIFVVATCASTLLTRILLSTGMTADNLKIFRFAYTYVSAGDVLTPFTFAFNKVTTLFGVQPRLSGIYREPGLLPAFACWAAAYAHFRRWPLWVSAVCIAGSAVSLSSFGLPLAVYTGALLACLKAKIPLSVATLVLIGLLCLAWPIIYGMKDVGVGSKIASDSVSFRERLYLIQIAFSAQNAVFGDGLQRMYRANEGISLIAQTRLFGLFYVFVVLAYYFRAVKNFPFFIAGLIPALVIILTSQPISLDVPVFIIFTSWVALPEVVKGRARRSRREAMTASPWAVRIPISYRKRAPDPIRGQR